MVVNAVPTKFVSRKIDRFNKCLIIYIQLNISAYYLTYKMVNIEKRPSTLNKSLLNHGSILLF